MTRDRFLRIARVASALVVLLGISVLVGWIFDIGVLKTGSIGLATMKANTAASFVLAGASLWLQIKPTMARQRIGRALALLVAAVAVLTLIEDGLGVNFGIDQFLIRSAGTEVGVYSPGRMAPNTAVSFALAATVLVFLDTGYRAICRMLDTAIVTVFVIAFLAICGYAFSVTALYGVAGYAAIAAHTAAGFMVLATGVLCSRPERGMIAILAQDNSAGAAARRLLPLILVIPFVLGWLRLRGQQAGFYGTEFGLALMVTTTTGIMVLLTLWNGRVQGVSDGAREQTLRDEHFLFDLGELLRLSSRSSDVLLQVSTKLGAFLAVSRCLFIEIDVANGLAIAQDDYHSGLPTIAGMRPLSSYSVESRAESTAGQTVVCNDTRTDERSAPRYETAYAPAGIRAHVAVPLLRNGEWVATLMVSTHVPRVWLEREVKLIQAVAERTWLWFEHLRALEALRQREQELEVSEARLSSLNSELELRVQDRTSALGEALKEKEVLLQEVHHRVKNNLQVVSSLINMQMRQMTDVSARTSLGECKARVETIALIHEKLYKSKDYANVPFSDYARSLAANIFHATGISHGNVALNVDIDTVLLAVDKAIPCGLILNELITNALKHGFPAERRGAIRVALRHVNERILLVVGDDGVGMPPDFDPATSNSLGMQLVTTLVEQLHGHLEIAQGSGTTVRITFPLEA